MVFLQQLDQALKSLEEERGKNRDITKIMRENKENADAMNKMQKKYEQHLSKAKGKYDAEIKQTKAQVEELNRKVKSKDQEIGHLKQELIKAQEDVKRAKTQSVVIKSGSSFDDPEVKQKLDDLKKQVEEHIVTITRLETEKLNLENVIKQREEEIARKNGELKKKENELDEKEAELQEKKGEIEDLRVKKKDLEKKLSDTQDALKVMEQKKKDEARRADRLQVQNNELNQQLNVLRGKTNKLRLWAYERCKYNHFL